MEANANENPMAEHQPGDPEHIPEHLQRHYPRTSFLMELNLFLSCWIFIMAYNKDISLLLTYAAVVFVSGLLVIIYGYSPKMYASIDQACQPRVKSWVAALLMSALGAVYPACLWLSKKRWIIAFGWVMLALHVLSAVLQYYYYISLSVKGFGQKSVHPVRPGTEEDV